MKKNISRMAMVFIGLFGLLILYLSYLNVYLGPEIVQHPTNKRTFALEKEIKRGDIRDSQGKIFATSDFQDGKFVRKYPLGPLFSDIIGYNSSKYGRSGLELSYNQYLLGQTGLSGTQNLFNRLQGTPLRGDNLTLTVDSRLQQLGDQLLGNRRGAIVVMNPQDGAILAMVTKPAYDNNQVDELWDKLNQDKNSPLLNRASQGLYPPGSILKVVTAAGALEDIPGITQQTFSCPGYLQIGNYRLQDMAVHGRVNLTEALVESCNTTFGTLGMELGSEKLRAEAKKFGFGREWSLPIPTKSSFIPPDNLTKSELAQTAIGQGRVLVTPLHMALIAATIANDGAMPKPYLVQKISNAQEETLWEESPQTLGQIIDVEQARFLQQAMDGVVQRGTGKAARIQGIKVGGKTGSAENPHGKAHAWFIGFAPVDHPQYVVAVIVENAGFGGREAAPIAREILNKAFQLKR